MDSHNNPSPENARWRRAMLYVGLGLGAFALCSPTIGNQPAMDTLSDPRAAAHALGIATEAIGDKVIQPINDTLRALGKGACKTFTPFDC